MTVVSPPEAPRSGPALSTPSASGPRTPGDPAPPAARRPGRTGSTWWRVGAVGQFAAAGLVALAVLAVAMVLVIRHIGANEALHEARDMSWVEAQAVRPDISAGVVAGDPVALAAFDARVRDKALNDRVLRVKLWSADGRVLYADDPALIGQRFTLGEDQLSTLRTGRPTSDVSSLTAPENRLEHNPSDQRLLEVYQRVHGPDGRPLLFESYQRWDSVMASSRRVWTAVLPALLLALVALELLQVPLAKRLTRRLRQGERDRDVLRHRAEQASDAERRRIVGELHDGVVQTLAGVSYCLGSARAEIVSRCSPAASGAVDDAAEATRRSIRELRSLLVSIYPPSLQQAGLGPALQDLTGPLAARGLACHLSVPADLAWPQEVQQLTYRTVQEAVRNSLRHARAHRVDVEVCEVEPRPGERWALAVVRDDGIGLDVVTGDERPRLGLRLLAESATSLGGRLHVTSVPGQGTTVHLEVPVR